MTLQGASARLPHLALQPSRTLKAYCIAHCPPRNKIQQETLPGPAAVWPCSQTLTLSRALQVSPAGSSQHPPTANCLQPLSPFLLSVSVPLCLFPAALCRGVAPGNSCLSASWDFLKCIFSCPRSPAQLSTRGLSQGIINTTLVALLMSPREAN